MNLFKAHKHNFCTQSWYIAPVVLTGSNFTQKIKSLLLSKHLDAKNQNLRNRDWNVQYYALKMFIYLHTILYQRNICSCASNSLTRKPFWVTSSFSHDGRLNYRENEPWKTEFDGSALKFAGSLSQLTSLTGRTTLCHGTGVSNLQHLNFTRAETPSYT